MSARGERLEHDLAPEICALIYEPRLQREMAHALNYMHAVNQAHLLMLVARNLIPRASASLVAREMLALETLGPPGLPNDPSLEDLYFNYESALTSRVGVAAAGSLHLGRSRNDIGATIDRMRARADALDLVSKVNEVRQALLDQAERYVDVVMPGYTHLQPSQPITFGFYLLGVATALGRDVERVLAEYNRINRSPLGAGAMAGTSFSIDRELTARALGFGGVAEHSLDAVASRDYMISLCSACVSLSTAGSRLAQDLYVWSTMEFGLVEFPDSVAGVSSIMPQKKNPVVLEVLKANAGEVIGDYVAMLATMRATHFTHSIDATRACLNRAWSIVESCQHSATLLKLLITSVIPCEARMRSLVAANFTTMTDLADFLVRPGNVTFREAHHVVGRLVRTAIERQVPADRITAAMIAEAATRVLGRPLSCSPEEMADILDPAKSVARRVSMGSPAPAEAARMIDEQRKALVDAVRVAQDASDAIEAANKELKRSIAAIAVDIVPER